MCQGGTSPAVMVPVVKATTVKSFKMKVQANRTRFSFYGQCWSKHQVSPILFWIKQKKNKIFPLIANICPAMLVPSYYTMERASSYRPPLRWSPSVYATPNSMWLYFFYFTIGEMFYPWLGDFDFASTMKATTKPTTTDVGIDGCCNCYNIRWIPNDDNSSVVQNLSCLSCL